MRVGEVFSLNVVNFVVEEPVFLCKRKGGRDPLAFVDNERTLRIQQTCEVVTAA